VSAQHDLLLFGGAANLGLWVVRHARQRGQSVACFVRSGRDTTEIEALGATIVRGDAFLPPDCARAFAAARPAAALSVLGGKDATGRRVDAEGNIHVIDAARAWHPELPFLLLTSLGCDEQFEQLPPPVQAALGEALQAKTRAERHLRETGLDWRIVRPGGLSHQDGRGGYVVADATAASVEQYITSADAALAALDVLADPARRRQTVTVLGVKQGG